MGSTHRFHVLISSSLLSAVFCASVLNSSAPAQPAEPFHFETTKAETSSEPPALTVRSAVLLSNGELELTLQAKIDLDGACVFVELPGPPHQKKPEDLRPIRRVLPFTTLVSGGFKKGETEKFSFKLDKKLNGAASIKGGVTGMKLPPNHALVDREYTLTVGGPGGPNRAELTIETQITRGAMVAFEARLKPAEKGEKAEKAKSK